MTRTITHLYDSYDEATRAVRLLEDSGIAHSDISIVGRDGTGAGAAAGYPPTGTMTADRTDVPADDTAASSGTGAGAGASVGTVVGGGVGLLAGIGALAIPGVGPVVAAGWLIATITGAGIGAGAGGLLGSLTGAGHREEDAHVYAEGVRRGGTLVSVRVDDAQAQQVETMLNGTGRVDIAQRGTEYRSSGWDRFDENRPLTETRPLDAPAATGMTGTAATAPIGSLPTTTSVADGERERAERERLGSSLHN